MAESVGCGFKSCLQPETFLVGIKSLSLPLLQLSFLPVEFTQDVTIINDKNHLRSSEPCLQTSLYRLLWVVYQVPRPLITLPLITLVGKAIRVTAKFTDLSL